MQIRKANPEDATQILACLAAAFAPYREAYTEGAWRDTVLDPATLQQRFFDMTVLVAERERIVGTVAYKIEHLDEAHLRGMAVLPEEAGSGVAQALLDHAETEVRGQGATAITLDTTAPLQRAIRFYERNGFRATGEVTEFFGMELFAYRKTL